MHTYVRNTAYTHNTYRILKIGTFDMSLMTVSSVGNKNYLQKIHIDIR